MGAYTERVVHVSAALLLSAYSAYRLLHVPPDIIVFTRKLWFGMEVPLRSPANLCKLLEVLDVIEATGFTVLQEQSWDRRSRAIDYYPGHTERGDDCFHCDLFDRQNIDENMAGRRSSATLFVLGYLECG